jgi:hypothetical protein
LVVRIRDGWNWLRIVPNGGAGAPFVQWPLQLLRAVRIPGTLTPMMRMVSGGRSVNRCFRNDLNAEICFHLASILHGTVIKRRRANSFTVHTSEALLLDDAMWRAVTRVCRGWGLQIPPPPYHCLINSLKLNSPPSSLCYLLSIHKPQSNTETRKAVIAERGLILQQASQVTPCSLVDRYRYLGETSRIHFHDIVT